MPPTSKRSKSSKRVYNRSKPSYRKAKQVVAKQQKKVRSRNTDTLSVLCKSEYLVTPSQGLNVANYITMFFPILPTSGNDFPSVYDNRDFVMYRAMYDRFRVNSMLTQFTPRPNVLDQANAQNDEGATHQGDNLLHSVIDRDGRGPTNIGSMTAYSSYQKHSILKKQSRKYTVKYPQSMWLDTATPDTSSQATKILGLSGGISYYGENFVEDAGEIWNEPIGTFTVWWRVVFQGKTATKVSYNQETGEVCITPAERFPLKDLSPIYGIHGTINDKRLRFNLSGEPVADPIDDANDVD